MFSINQNNYTLIYQIDSWQPFTLLIPYKYFRDDCHFTWATKLVTLGMDTRLWIKKLTLLLTFSLYVCAGNFGLQKALLLISL